MINDLRVEEPAKPVNPIIPSDPELSKPGELDNGSSSIDAIKPSQDNSNNAEKQNTGDRMNVSGILFAFILSGCGVVMLQRRRNKKA